jgi:aryl sulfotransferase
MFFARDPRDVFMSLWNHFSNHTPEFFAQLNGLPGRVGDPFPPCPAEPRALFREWISRGWFAWEEDGWPYWSLLHHARTWWSYRHLENILCVHYGDLLADLEGEVRRIAAFLGIERSDADFAAIAEACRFENAQKNAARIVGDMSESFRGGSSTFLYKGTNGRWTDVLTHDDLALYRKAMDRLPPDLARWLEEGGPAT